jgi:hypothetical protein
MTKSAKPRDSQNNNATPRPTPKTWQEVFAALDAAEFPDGFMEDRDQGTPESREMF